jgi:vacuolar-type H+-ATPase subunit E/Vma4
MLERLIKQEIRNSLTPEGLAKIISGLLKPEALAKAEAVISLQKEDLEALEKFFFTRLKEELRKGIVLRPEQEINAGFTISFDRGRSQFDFTDKALAEYIAGFLKPKLNQLFKEALEK